MSASNCFASACRYCRYFTPEGRRGGHCQQLGVPVQSKWKACCLAIPPFAPSWENTEAVTAAVGVAYGTIANWPPQTLVLPDILSLERSLKSTEFPGAAADATRQPALRDAKAMLV
ncbi:MAG TPA: hypothetical protein IGS52_24315 [Oscillatoriaceae cyanobacterium M33_DOE_052]|uniref:Uncharacterized protein n=1 Tax=Planktothricoides sp. SpSt-374 TaxID=2282167 RepID=A0A7C3VPT1_9CYAN|nr:hypothetical protein [Oscillatoriaceae cyanobacterium M33_DOE_052]